jgi:hypothetical protein
MGLDLRLLPVDSMWNGGTAGNCHTILNTPRDYDLYDDIRTAKPEALPVGHNFTSHLGVRIPDGSMAGEPSYGRLDRDSYGELYTWIRADALGPILWKHYAAHPVSSYIMALPPDTMVVLDWH